MYREQKLFSCFFTAGKLMQKANALFRKENCFLRATFFFVRVPNKLLISVLILIASTKFPGELTDSEMKRTVPKSAFFYTWQRNMTVMNMMTVQ